MKSLLRFILLFSAVSAIANTVEHKPALPDFSVLLHGADAIVVYEGLPHPMFEEGAHEEERLTKKVFSVSRELFYERPLTMPDEDRNALDQIFRTISVCVPFRGEKFCGGFHADYMVEWKHEDERVAAALLCFGCHELIVVVGARSQRTDMSKPGFEALQPILKKYRQERPPFRAGVAKPLKPEITPLPPPKIDVKM